MRITTTLHRQPEIAGRVVHPVKQAMARRAEYPHHLRPLAVGPRPMLTEAWGRRLVGYLQHSRFAAALAGLGGVGIAPVEAHEVPFGQNLGARPRSVDRFHSRTSKMERPHRAGLAGTPTFGRTQPLVSLSGLERDG